MESNAAHAANVYQTSLCASSGGTRDRNRDTSLPPLTAQGPVRVGHYKPKTSSVVSGLGLCALGALGAQRSCEEECKGESRKEWA